MVEITFSAPFKRAFKKKVKGKQGVESKYWEKVYIFIKNPGAAIAHRIYHIYNALKARRWECLTTNCTECRPQDAFSDLQ